MIVLIWIAAFIFALMVIIAGRIAGYYEYLSILAESAMLTEAAAEVADKTAEVETPKKEPQAVKTAEVETSKKEPQAVKTAQTVDRGHHQVIYMNDPKAAPSRMKRLPRQRSAASFGDDLIQSIYPVTDKVDATRVARQKEIDKAIDADFARRVAIAASQERDRSAAVFRQRREQDTVMPVVPLRSAKKPKSVDDGYERMDGCDNEGLDEILATKEFIATGGLSTTEVHNNDGTDELAEIKELERRLLASGSLSESIVEDAIKVGREKRKLATKAKIAAVLATTNLRSVEHHKVPAK